MADSEFSKYANAVAMRESALRQQAANIANMGSTIQQMGVQTQAPGQINPAEIPTVAGLANLQATAQTQSSLRAERAKTTTARLPAWQKSYRSYLQWRYPSRYGGGNTYNYTAPAGSYTPSVAIPKLPAITPPKFAGTEKVTK